MARKSKLTANRKRDIIRLLEEGNTDKDVCAAVGISDTAFYNWLKDGEEGKSASKVAFLESVIRARWVARQRAIDALRSAMIGQETTEVIKRVIEEPVKGKGGEIKTDQAGKPMLYKRSEIQERKTHTPPDFRAAIEYLKRRDGEHWSEKLQAQLEATVNVYHTYETEADEFDRLFSQLIARGQQEQLPEIIDGRAESKTEI